MQLSFPEAQILLSVDGWVAHLVVEASRMQQQLQLRFTPGGKLNETSHGVHICS